MYCLNCGKHIKKSEKDADSCPVCGEQLLKSPAESRLPDAPCPLCPLAAPVLAAGFMVAALGTVGADRLRDASPGAATLFAIFVLLDFAVLWLLLPRRKK